MLINLRNALMTGKKSPLPPGARWVEYLESTGTQYINTGWIPVRGAKLSIDCAVMMSVDDPPMQCGCINNGRKPYYNWYWSGSNQSDFFLVNYFGDFSETSWGGANRYTKTPVGSIRWDVRNVATYDGVTGVSTLNDDVFQGGACNSTPSVPFFLYARNNRGVAELFSKLKVYGFSVDIEGEKTLDLHPIAIGDTGYMLDLVSGEYLPYGNKGTGNFVIGPDIPSPA